MSVSMLMIGSAFLVGRKPHAVWFLRQAIVANVLWIVAKLGSQLWHSFARVPEVKAILAAAEPRAGPLPEPSIAMVVGIAFILVAATRCIHTMSAIRWVTQDLEDDLEATALAVIERRNAQQANLQGASYMVAIGLGAYLASVAIAALANGLG